MCLPSLFGTVEIEERRPRTWNEPRRKRLNFVHSHHRRGASDEWALVPPNGHGGQRMGNDAETWDRRQWEAQGRFAQQEHVRRLHAMHFQQQQMQQMAQLGGNPAGLQPRIEERAPRGYRKSRDDDSDDSNAIIAIEDGSDSDDSDDDHYHSHHRIRPRPIRRISKSRDRAELPRIIQIGGKKSSKKHEPDEFVEGFRAGRRASMHRRYGSSRGGSDRAYSPRKQRFERHDDSVSEDSMDFRRKRRRSRSRGLPWGF